MQQTDLICSSFITLITLLFQVEHLDHIPFMYFSDQIHLQQLDQNKAQWAICTMTSFYY